MATVTASSDQAAVLLQKLSLDAQPNPLESEPTKKLSTNQNATVDTKDAANSQLYERSLTPLLQDFMEPAQYYFPNGYPSGYYYGGYEGSTEWEEYAKSMNPDGVEMPQGLYGDNGSMMYPGYGYAPYTPYAPTVSMVPTLGHDGQFYGPQQYQYPPYFTPTSGPYLSNPAVSVQSDGASLTAPEKKLPSVESSNGIASGGNVKGNNGPAPVKSTYKNTSYNTNGSNGRGGISQYGYQDARYNYDALRSPMPWSDGPSFFDGQPRPGVGTTTPNMFSNTNKNQYARPHSNYMGVNQSTPMSGIGSAQGFMNRTYPKKSYDQYGNGVRSGYGYNTGYDSKLNGRGWYTVDNRYKLRGRGNGFVGYGNENMDVLNELNKGPRAKVSKDQNGLVPITIAVKGVTLLSNETKDVKEKSILIPNRELYNLEDFPVDYAYAKFFIIKSYSEDDVHKSIKYNMWASTPNGNKKLDTAYREAQEKSGPCPIFLFFSVNTSGQFVGLAEMVGPVDFDKNLEYWQQDKWNGCFSVKWHIVKDVPNNLLKHIILENNENKPVTNSRDTQEVKLEQGLQVLKIFKEHSSKTCILDDFEFYEARQKTIQEKKTKQQFQKQELEAKFGDEKNKGANAESKSEKTLLVVSSEMTKDPTLTMHANGVDKKLSDSVC